MTKVDVTTANRASQVNNDTSIYGTFAEIGAGQEVARHFFQAGRASQTVAKTISAYDMIYSDEIYGKEDNGRYVCESRLSKMLNKEYNLLLRRLANMRGERTRFFAYANTVTTGDGNKRSCHGWMGVRFQKTPGGASNEIILHVRMLDRHRLQQQETLGILGANLVWTAYFATDHIKDLIPALTANIKEGRLAIEMVRCSGPDLSDLDNRLLNLELVRRGLAEAVLFGPDATITNVADTLFNKPVIVDRGEFRPITKTHTQLIQRGLEQFPKDFPQAEAPIVLFEITMQNLMGAGEGHGEVDEKDFLDRVATLSALGHHVLVSNFFLFYQLKRFLRRATRAPMGILIKATHLSLMFDPSHYRDLDGGLLEAFGKLLDQDTRIYAYPQKTSTECLLAESFAPTGALKKIFDYFSEQKLISNLKGCENFDNFIHSEEAREKLQQGDSSWEQMVPPEAVSIIKSRSLFGYKKT